MGQEADSGGGPRGSRWQQTGVRATVVAVGLAVGLGGFGLVRSLRSGDDGARPARSVERFEFSAPGQPVAVAGLVPPAGPESTGPQTEPSDAASALATFRQAALDGRPQEAWLLLDAAGRERYPTAAAWSAAQVDRPTPIAFEITRTGPADQASVPGDLDLAVASSYRPLLDQFSGLVAARTDEVWRVRNEGGRWRVAADPVDTRPVLPPDDTAPAAVRSWVDRAAACDAEGAAQLQVGAGLLGPADLARLPCERRDAVTWEVGRPVTVDRSDDARTLLAAYGPGAASWARLVPVRGSDRSFFVQVAPLGDTWKIVGLAVGG